MCGLVGVAGIVDKEALDAISFLGILSSLRGMDSTGLLGYAEGKRGSPYHVFRTLKSSFDFFSNEGDFDLILRGRYLKNKPKFIAVHSRYATIGGVTKENAHPFTHGNIVGMHNGTIRSEFKNKDKFKTDSEAIIYNISQDEKETLTDLEVMFNAAYALVWANSKENTLNFFRNKERPLHFFTTYDEQVMFWASDKRWLEGVLYYFSYKGRFEELPENKLVSFNFKDHKFISNPTVVNYRWKEIQPKVPVKMDMDYSDHEWCYKTNKWIPKEEADANRKPKFQVVPQSGDIYCKTYQENWVTREKYIDLLKRGCEGCTHEADLGEQIRFVSKDAYLCKTCKDDTIITKIVLEELSIMERKVG